MSSHHILCYYSRTCRKNTKGLSRELRPISFSSAAPVRTLSFGVRAGQRPATSALLFLNRDLVRRSAVAQVPRHSYVSKAEGVKKTPLHDLHVSKRAKFVPFGGYSMPLYYEDLSHAESHHWTREKASLFDVSHMVQHKLSGPSAAGFLMQVTPTAVDILPKYRSMLSCLLEDPSGGIVDDTVITRVGDKAFYFVTNAACRENDLTFLQNEMTKFKQIHEVKDENDLDWMVLDKHSLLALQGPKSSSVLQSLVFVDEEDPQVDTDLTTLSFGNARYLQLKLPDKGINTPSLLVSRTGYTGEDGFEISIPPEGRGGNSKELATHIAEALLAADGGSTVRLAGLAARDSLRLEAGMCLYGHDIDVSTTPPEAGLGWTVSKERRSSSTTTTTSNNSNNSSNSSNFNGSAKILQQLSSPKTMIRRRVALVAEKGAPAREGAEIVDPDTDDVVGKVTSGLPSPTLGGTNIAMGLVKNGWHKRGTRVAVKVRKNVRAAEVVKLPFVENKFYRG